MTKITNQWEHLCHLFYQRAHDLLLHPSLANPQMWVREYLLLLLEAHVSTVLVLMTFQVEFFFPCTRTMFIQSKG